MKCRRGFWARGIRARLSRSTSPPSPATVPITARKAITSCAIRPKSRGVEARVSGKVLEFSFPGPDKLYIEIEDPAPLCLFADPMETDVPKPHADNVLYFGLAE